MFGSVLKLKQNRLTHKFSATSDRLCIIFRFCLRQKVTLILIKSSEMKYSTSATPSESGSMLSGYSFRSGRSHLPRPATANLCSSATTKTSKYLRRLIKFRQMDFEYAFWQMIYLFVAPQKVYRNFGYRKGKHLVSNIFRLFHNNLLVLQKRNHSSLETILLFLYFFSLVYVVSKI